MSLNLKRIYATLILFFVSACIAVSSITPTIPIITPPVAPSEVNTYYVNHRIGSDSNPGTRALPWKTIQKAADTLTIGNTIIVQTGNYPERVRIDRGGTANAPITFQTQGSVSMYGFTVQANYVTIRGFEITDTPDNSRDGYGIWLQGSGCVIENNYIHHATRGGIQIYARLGADARTTNCLVLNNRLYRNAMVGIEIYGRNHVVEGNEIWGTIQYHFRWKNPPSSVDADGVRFFGSGHVLRGNYIHDILFSDPENLSPHIDCFQTWEDSYREAAHDVLIEKNRCDNVQAQSRGVVGQGFMLHNASNLTIRNNLIKAYKGINGVGCSSLVIINNTVVNSLSLPTTFHPVGITLTNTIKPTIKNNIFYDQPGNTVFLSQVSGLDNTQNLSYRSDGQDLWTTDTYPHKNDLWNINPLFVSAADYHLTAGSPAIDAGAMVAVSDDFDGNPRPQGDAIDIGAFEY
jgi:hypothetical protein